MAERKLSNFVSNIIFYYHISLRPFHLLTPTPRSSNARFPIKLLEHFGITMIEMLIKSNRKNLSKNSQWLARTHGSSTAHSRQQQAGIGGELRWSSAEEEKKSSNVSSDSCPTDCRLLIEGNFHIQFQFSLFYLSFLLSSIWGILILIRFDCITYPEWDFPSAFTSFAFFTFTRITFTDVWLKIFVHQMKNWIVFNHFSSLHSSSFWT